jgi:GxxExxY protein
MIHHGDTETRRGLLHEELTERVFGAVIEVHRALGPGLLESVYEECLCHEFHLQGISFERQRPLPVEYKSVNLECEYRLDLIVENKLILEIKCVERILPVHKAQLLTYLKMTGMRVGLILNFNKFNVSILSTGGIVQTVH